MTNLPDDPVVRAGSAGASNANLVYILYLVGLVLGVTAIVGVVMAYVNRGDAEPWLRTHYDFQIRTFWIGLLYSVVGFVLALVLVGFLILAFALVWYIVRCARGMSALGRNEPIANPRSWLFG
jgi:uncharacterized membrane protein